MNFLTVLFVQYTFSVFPGVHVPAFEDILPGKLVWYVSTVENILAEIFLFSYQICFNKCIR